jgi:TRAP-type mannitol/chloroaromatic compound transport system permease large subunit
MDTDPKAALSAIPEQLIRALPPAMTIVVVLNVLFMGMATYLIGHNLEARNAMLSRIVETCLQARP